MKKRLDILLTDRGLAPTRSRARALIMEGAVFVNGQREDKAGSAYEEDADIVLKSNPIPFVSRGGLKIQKALQEFSIDIADKICMDVGASTGGFTDCMLSNGAAMVYSIDVGYGQLDYKLRCDDRVVVMERTNIRNLEPNSLDPVPEFASIDVSFISLKKVIPVVKTIEKPGSCIVALIKPQFEAGKELVGKNGVVREKSTHYDVVKDVTDFVQNEGYKVLGLSYSPIKGPKGNIEFLMYIKDMQDEKDFPILEEESIRVMVECAHNEME